MMELRFAMRQYQSTAATTTEMTTTAIAQSPTGTQEATTKEHRKMSTISTAVPSARILYDFITPEDEVYLVHVSHRFRSPRSKGGHAADESRGVK